MHACPLPISSESGCSSCSLPQLVGPRLSPSFSAALECPLPLCPTCSEIHESPLTSYATVTKLCTKSAVREVSCDAPCALIAGDRQVFLLFCCFLLSWELGCSSSHALRSCIRSKYFGYLSMVYGFLSCLFVLSGMDG